MLQSESSLNNFSKQMNVDFKNLSQWLKANKLSLNVTNTEPIIFHSSSKSIDHSCIFKSDGKLLTPTNTLKCVGVFLDEDLLWSTQLDHITARLNLQSFTKYLAQSKEIQ